METYRILKYTGPDGWYAETQKPRNGVQEGLPALELTNGRFVQEVPLRDFLKIMGVTNPLRPGEGV